MKKMIKDLKKGFVLFLAMCLMAGCAAKPDVPDENADEDEDDRDRDDERDDDRDDDGLDDDGEGEGGNAESGSGITVMLSGGFTSDVIYIFDAEGRKLRELERKDLAENISADELFEYRVYNDSESMILGNDAENIRSRAYCEGDGFVFFEDFVYSEEYGQHAYIVYAISEDGHKLYPIWSSDMNSYFMVCDYYDGYLYIDYNAGYDSAGKFMGYREVCFAYDEVSDSFKEEESNADAVLRVAADQGIYIRSACTVGSQSDSFGRTLDECGFLIGSSNDGYFMINEKGMTEKLCDTIDNIFNVNYGPDCMVYCCQDYETGMMTMNILDVRTGKSYVQYEGNVSGGFLGREDWKYYYYISTYEEYGVNHNHIYEYNYANGETTLLYEVKSDPASGIYNPGVEDFRICGGIVYITSFDDGDIKWVKAGPWNGAFSFEDIDCPVRHLGLFDLGTVGYSSYSYCCPDCGTALVQKYAENFVLSDEYSRYADKINQILTEKQLEFISAEESPEFTESACDDHLEHPTWYRVTDDLDVSKVTIIDDRYLAVNMSGYWYGGGAHGMPKRVQYLFDLETGEECTFADFYEGTEEDFKTLIAEETVKDYESYGDYAPYYSYDDMEKLYDDAYSQADINSPCIEFTENGIIYYYPPYVMGPYAGGYIDVDISYITLFNRGSLVAR